jgi:hypothetical protein
MIRNHLKVAAAVAFACRMFAFAECFLIKAPDQSDYTRRVES